MEFNSFAAEVAPAVKPAFEGYTALPQDAWGWYEIIMGSFLGIYPVMSARARDYDCWSRHINLGLRMVDWHYFFDGAFDGTLLWNWIAVIFKLVFDIMTTYNLLAQCKSQLDWGVWSGWAAKFKKNSAASENPFSTEQSFMMEAAPFDDDASLEGNWLHDFMTNMDPHGNLFDEEAAAMEQSHPVVGATVYYHSLELTSYKAPINGWRLTAQLMSIVEEAVKTVYFFSSNFYYYNLGKSFFKLMSTIFTMIDHVFMLNIITPIPVWNRYRTNA